MTDEGDEKPFVRLAETEATTDDGDRARMEALSKGGESRPKSEAEELAGAPTDSEE